MAVKKKKVSARRKRVRDSLSAERMERISSFAGSAIPLAIIILLLFVAAATALLSINISTLSSYDPEQTFFKPFEEIFAIATLVVFVSIAAALYIHHYQPSIILRPAKMFSLAIMFLFLLGVTKLTIILFPEFKFVATGSAVTSAIILTITYNQRFALGITLGYSILACFAITIGETTDLFLTMAAGSVACCFSLKEIRTRMKLVEVTLLAALVVFITAASLMTMKRLPVGFITQQAASAAIMTLAVGVVIQAFLPLIEKAFGIATSMTLLDYSDANQPLLKKLAMEAPGTFSHSLLIGSIAEAAAESIGANGLLCRVGAYYHDIGKINKPPYFVENQMGSANRHEQLSPAMSQLVIVGHVKDGIEIAKEYGIPAVIRQFIETHHGTTLIEYFYNEAKKKVSEKGGTVSDSEFRYPGPKPQTKEAAIVMLGDACESAARTLSEPTPPRVQSLVHTMAMKRLQDGQFDECDLTLKELHKIEQSLTKALSAHHHNRISYPKTEDAQGKDKPQMQPTANGNQEK